MITSQKKKGKKEKMNLYRIHSIDTKPHTVKNIPSKFANLYRKNIEIYNNIYTIIPFNRYAKDKILSHVIHRNFHVFYSRKKNIFF